VGEEAVLNVIERIVARLGLRVDAKRHLGWTRDLRTALGCIPTALQIDVQVRERYRISFQLCLT
jgi:hypothetical protein